MGTGRCAVALLCVAQFVVVLDVTIVTTALPALGRELGFRPQELPWVVTAYTLCFGGFLIVGGRVADLLGARRAFAVGLAGFTAASLLCALAGSAGLLIAFRALQGHRPRRCCPRPRWRCSPRARKRGRRVDGRSGCGPPRPPVAGPPAGCWAGC